MNQIFLKFINICSGQLGRASYILINTSTSGGSSSSRTSLIGERGGGGVLVFLGEEGDGGVESGERIIWWKEFGKFEEGKNWREIRGKGIGEGEALGEEISDIIGEEGVESGERIIYFEESGEIGRGKNWREVRGTGMGKGEGGRLRKAHKATVVGGEGCLAAEIYELNYSEIYDFTLTNNIHVIYDWDPCTKLIGGEGRSKKWILGIYLRTFTKSSAFFMYFISKLATD